MPRFGAAAANNEQDGETLELQVACLHRAASPGDAARLGDVQPRRQSGWTALNRARARAWVVTGRKNA